MLDPKFRFALNFAVDREQIIRTVYQGGGKPGATIIPPAYPDFQWAPDDPDAFAFDLDKAGQLLDEAGYALGSDGKRTLPNGDPIGTLRLAARADSGGGTSVSVMEFFQEWLAELGIDAEVETYESSKLTSVILDGEFDTFEWGWYVEPDPDSMLSYMTCGQLGSWSDSWYCNEEYDALYDAQHVEMDDAARADMVKQMQEILYRRRAVPGDGVLLDRRGLPQRPVRLLPAAARPGRHLAGAVRRPELPQRPSRRRGR